MQSKGRSPAIELKVTSPAQAQAGGRPVVYVVTTFRRKTSPQPRALRPVLPVTVEKAGRRTGFRSSRPP